jgi:membrane dipeptidase
VSLALDYVFDTEELEAYTRAMQGTFPPGLGYELGARFVAPEQLEKIVQTLQVWGYGDEDLKAVLGGNLLRLARTVWRPPSHV